MADISAVCLATANPGQAGTKKRPPVSRTKKHDEVGNTGLPSKGVSLLPMINSEEAKNAWPGHSFGEFFHQWPEPMFRHVGDQLVEHAALPKQRMRARLAGVRF